MGLQRNLYRRNKHLDIFANTIISLVANVSKDVVSLACYVKDRSRLISTHVKLNTERINVIAILLNEGNFTYNQRQQPGFYYSI